MKLRYIYIFIALILKGSIFGQELDFESSNLPIFIITTEDGLSIPDEPKINAHLGVINNPNRNYITDAFTDYNGKIAIELRGNGSLLLDKNSFGFETRLENDENNNVSLLGLPKENDWILYAPYTDKTLMRNVLTYDLGNKMGYYASKTAFCEVIVNGEYLGIFVLMEKIKRDKNRVNITEFEEHNQNLPHEGGYIVRIDSWWNEALGWEGELFEYDGQERKIVYQYVYPKAEDITEMQANYISQVIGNFEKEMAEEQADKLYEVYSSLIDVNSFADFILINELTKNPDGYRLSTFLHKDADSVDPRLKLGPIWDFNFGMGNYWGDYHTNPTGWEFDNDYWDFPSQIPFWIPKLMESPEFQQLINERWRMWRNSTITCASFEEEIEKWYTLLSEAQVRNFSKWPILGINAVVDWNAGPTYEDEINLLENWICDRIQWMDEQLPKLLTESSISNTIVYPNPNEGAFTLQVKSDTEAERLVRVYNSSGSLLYSETIQTVLGINEHPITISQLEQGFYLLEVDGESAVKLVIY